MTGQDHEVDQVLQAMAEAAGGMVAGRAVTAEEADTARDAQLTRFDELFDSALAEAATPARALLDRVKPWVGLDVGPYRARVDATYGPEPDPFLGFHDVQDPTLGAFAWDPPWLSGRIPTRDGGISLVLEMVDAEELGAMLAYARRLAEEVDNLIDSALRYAGEPIAKQVNGGYLKEGDKAVTPDGAVARLRPCARSLTLGAGAANATLSFDDDDLLWGHGISIRFDERDQPVDVEMWG